MQSPESCTFIGVDSRCLCIYYSIHTEMAVVTTPFSSRLRAANAAAAKTRTHSMRHAV
jgi:hypothetical protein